MKRLGITLAIIGGVLILESHALGFFAWAPYGFWGTPFSSASSSGYYWPSSSSSSSGYYYPAAFLSCSSGYYMPSSSPSSGYYWPSSSSSSGYWYY